MNAQNGNSCRTLNPQVIPTKNLPSSLCQPKQNKIDDLSIVVRNSKFTRLIWTTHNDFHKHAFWEICLVLKGRGKHYFPDHEEDMSPGAIWILRPNDIHRIEPIDSTSYSKTSGYAHRDIYVKEEKMRQILNSFDPNLYDNLLNAPAPLSAMLPVASVKHIESMISYYSVNDENFEFMHSVLVSHVISATIEQNNYIRHDMPDWLNTLIAKLNNEEFMILPMESIISSTGYTQSYVCRQFKKYMSTTLGKYIQQTKCLYSLSLLTDLNIPITDIAHELCFPDESNYISTFKKIYNITPGQWRKKLKNK